eukprot:532381-Rhodomonas_salina.1
MGSLCRLRYCDRGSVCGTVVRDRCAVCGTEIGYGREQAMRGSTPRRNERSVCPVLAKVTCTVCA